MKVLNVGNPMRGRIAFKGVKANDRLITINGEDVCELGYDKVMEIIMDKSLTDLELIIQRKPK